MTFKIGKASRLTPERDQYDVVFIANGETVYPAFLASKILDQQGLSTCVISMHTIRPLDEETIQEVAQKSRVILTVEEHSVNGGLGSIIASLLFQTGIYKPLRIVGIPDEHTVSGSQDEIFDYYGINPQSLADTAIELLEKTNK